MTVFNFERVTWHGKLTRRTCVRSWSGLLTLGFSTDFGQGTVAASLYLLWDVLSSLPACTMLLRKTVKMQRQKYSPSFDVSQLMWNYLSSFNEHQNRMNFIDSTQRKPKPLDTYTIYFRSLGSTQYWLVPMTHHDVPPNKIPSEIHSFYCTFWSSAVTLQNMIVLEPLASYTSRSWTLFLV